MPSSIQKQSNVDVLIIGAGPAGVMACNALARNGINVRIIDQRPVKVEAGHADGIQPRTIEVFQSYGLAERLLKNGNEMHMAAFYNPSPGGGIELTDRVPDVTAPSARYPFEVTLHQGEIESMFLDSMLNYGVSVDRALTPTAIDVSGSSDYPVTVVLKHLSAPHEGESEEVHAKYVIGADGAHSWVRKSMNIAMEGEKTNYIWGVVDIIPDTNFPDIRNRTVIHSNNGSVMIIPREGDKVRIYIQLDESSSQFTMNGRIDKNQLQLRQLLEAAQRSLHPYYIKPQDDKIEWWTIYMIAQRVASTFSGNDRVFIVGDACHTHSPKAGQGMNASMNDSHNLAWKITHVLKGWTTNLILKTYEFERRKYAQDLIDFDKQFTKLFSGKPRTEEFQDGVSHEDFLKIFQTFGGFTSGIGICYAESLITSRKNQFTATNLILGQRLPPQILLRAADSKPVEIQDLILSDGRFKLLVFTGNTSDPEILRRVGALADDLKNCLIKFSPERIFLLFDILSISTALKSNVRFNDLPKLLRLHWSKVLIDDVDAKGIRGGDGYKNYGINPNGAIVVVRPDGYIGMIAPLSGIDEIDEYFCGFMKH